MEDDKFRDLFDSFRPPLSPADDFVKRVERNMEIVEELRASLKTDHRRQKRALFIAAFAGMAAGIVLTALFSHFVGQLPTLRFTSAFLGNMSLDLQVFVWIALAGVSALTARNAYETALAGH